MPNKPVRQSAKYREQQMRKRMAQGDRPAGATDTAELDGATSSAEGVSTPSPDATTLRFSPSGTATTTVAVNLALALAADGARVGIFDGDLYGPNVPLMLGVRRKTPPRGMLPVAHDDNSPPYIPAVERYGLKMMSIGLLVPDNIAVMP